MSALTVLVTGGLGFVGSNVVRLLRAERPDWRVVVLDALTYAGHRSTLGDLSEGSGPRVVIGDIADAPAMEALFAEERPRAVLNLAAESHVDRSIEAPAAFVRTNAQGVQVLLDAARRHQVETFVQVSTDEVYGALGPDDPRFTETSPLRPSSPYSASKTSGDLLALAWNHTYGMDVRVTRCTNNLGPYQFPEKLIPVAIAAAMDGRPIPVYGSGKQVRDWIHVDDHARALLAVLEEGRPGRVYNVGADGERQNLDIVHAILDQLGCPDDQLSHVSDRLGHDWRYGIDATRLRQETGWTPRWNPEEALQATVQWYVDHQPWWREVVRRSHSS